MIKVKLAKSSGFCFGVRRALEIAKRTIKAKPSIYMLGDIVHNKDVVKEIKKSGIIKTDKLSAGHGKTLLIRAHGAKASTYSLAQKLGYHIVDATCPMVKEIHKIAQRMEKQNYKIIVIGDKKHDEVQGIIGQLKNKALIIDPAGKISYHALAKIKKAAVVVQSTQNLEKVLKIVALLRNYISQVKFCNTICRPTRTKQQEIRFMTLENNVMIIIGSRSSANTRRLYEISKSLNKNTYWVQSKKQIKPRWLRSVNKVGVAAGASTPGATTQDVLKQIRKLSRAKAAE